MGSGQNRIDHLGRVTFNGQVGKHVSRYAQDLQALARDFAIELDTGAMEADAAMRKLKKHRLLRKIDVLVRSALVARHIRRGRDLCLGISAEAVKFNLQYRYEFLDIDDAGQPRSQAKHDDYDTGGVDL